ncbi:MAG: HAMP domain-containing sensor histidine kinase [Candidatus Daviesbacteria bacterium]
MENKGSKVPKLNLWKTLQNRSVEIVVHAIRILVKIGIACALLLSHNSFAIPLIVWLFISEIIDQTLTYSVKIKPGLKSTLSVFYVLNSILVISGIALLAKWSLNDFYLVYLIHISSATLAYGIKTGLLSFIASFIAYTALLVANQAPLEVYIRLPLLSILVLRLSMSQGRYETTSSVLSNLLDVEKSKQDFIGIASHNLRTPVAAIYGYIEVLLRGDVGDLNGEQKGYIEKIRSNNQELEKLTEQLLQISILEIGRELNLLKQPSQIEVMIEDMVEKMIPMAQTKGLTLSFQRENGLLPLVDIDVEKIKSVLLNLIDNAIKYTEKGSITVMAVKQGDYIKVAVKDTGVGISPVDLPKLFTKFYRSGNILVYNKIGLGLGLYLGKQILELHGGKIELESVEGQGSVFSFTLPILKEDIL